MNTNDVSELKTLIALTGNKRIPHLEAEIFADEELTTLYLDNICQGRTWHHRVSISGISRVAFDNARFTYLYSVFVLRHRWTAAEHIIKQSSLIFENYYHSDVDDDPE